MIKKTSTAILLIIIWVLGMLSLYYWGHKPFSLTQVIVITSNLLDIIIVALVIILAGGIGKRLLGSHKDQNSSGNRNNGDQWDGEKAILQAAAGLGVISLFWLVLGVIGLYYKAIAWVVLLAGLVIFRTSCLDWIKQIKRFSLYWHNGKRFDRIMIFFLFLLIILQIIWAAAPVTKYDALTYHLQLPRQYLLEHRFVFVPDNPYWGHPQLGEMLYTWLMLLNRGETCALMGTGWGILILLGVMSTISRLQSSHSDQFQELFGKRNESVLSADQKDGIRAGLIAAVALVCGLTFRDLFHWGYVDLLSALMGWAALAAFSSVFEGNAGKYTCWAGIFCAFAISTKWTAGIIALAVFLCFILLKKKADISWRNLVVSGSLTILIILPWLVKNIAMTGNPVYPYLFETPLISEQRLEASGIADSPQGWVQGLLFPVTSTVFGFDSATGFGTDLGPLLVLLAIPGLWPLRRTRIGLVISVGLILCWIAILAGSVNVNHLQQTRLYFALIPWVGVAAGMGWDYLSGFKTKILRIELLLSTLVIFVMVFVSFQELSRMAQDHPLQVALGLESRNDYLTQTMGAYTPAMKALHELPEDSKTLLLWEARGYYSPIDSTADLWIDRWRMDFWTYGSAERIIESWKLQGYTNVLLYRSGAERIRETDKALDAEGWNELDRVREILPIQQVFGDAYELYSLNNQMFVLLKSMWGILV